MAKIPFVDLSLLHLPHEDEIMERVRAVLRNGQFILGEEHHKFEDDFARFCEAAACAGVSSGTSALYLGLLALGVKPGDEVIVPDNTYAATANAACLIGAIPVFVDVTPGTLTLSPEAFESAVSERTTAVIPVHLYGHPADMDPIMAIAEKHEIRVLEDAAQAHGARYKDRSVGTLGHAAAFSFYPGKNLGALGDGGAVVSNDQDVIDRVKMFRNHGQPEKYVHDYVGDTARLDTMQATVLRYKLQSLHEQNKQRRAAAALYCDKLSDCSNVITLPSVSPDAVPVWHLFVIHTEDRERLGEVLDAADVSWGYHYPIPLSRQKAFEGKSRVCDPLSVSTDSAANLLSLPLFGGITEEQINQVSDAVHRFCE